MQKPVWIFLCLMATFGVARAQKPPSVTSAKCAAYADENRRRCLQRQLMVSVAALDASVLAVRKALARWDDSAHRNLVEASFDKTIAEFARYRRVQCEFDASLRYGLAGKDEIEIARLECMLQLNADRTRLFSDFTRSIVM